MKNSNDTIGNRTRDLPACSTVPQPTAPLHTPPSLVTENLSGRNQKCQELFVCERKIQQMQQYGDIYSQHSSSGLSKTVPAASGTGHTTCTCTATPLLHGVVWTSCTSTSPDQTT